MSGTNDDVREELRRAEAQEKELRAGNLALEARLLRQNAWRWWIVAAVAAFGAFGAIGFLSATAWGTRKVAAAHAQAVKDHENEIAPERASTAECREASRKALVDLLACTQELERLKGGGDTLPRPPPRNNEPCKCQPGDPLCSCL